MSSALAGYSEKWSNPFPGLRPFEPDEDYLFFGRERQTDDLLRRLRTTRFLSILGTSGSGKSSLVRSGLIPSLYGGGMTVAGSRWRMAIMRPGDDPIGNLAAALSAPEALGAQSDEEGMTRSFFETTLRASNLGLIECVQQARIAPRDNVLVLIDQFEELFRYKRSRRAAGRDDALAFVKLLLAARGSEAPLYIALTMRSDFIGDCMEFGGLPEVINDGVYLVSRMTRDELRLAITGPVAVGGATIAPRLVSRLLNDVGDDPDQLPILQHALMRTWEQWHTDHEPGEPLDLRHYEAIGTMQTALSRHAEEAFEELSGGEQVIAEKLFKALTDKETDVRGVRRPAAMAEICALTGAALGDVAAVVDHFREHGRTFLMPPAGTTLVDDSIIDISHESLMRVWTRLSAWADDESKSAQIYMRVARAAELHEQGAAALWRDPELQLALTWRDSAKPVAAWAARYDTSFDRAMTFLDASRDDRDREIRARETRRRVLAAILIAASLVIAAFGVYAFKQKMQAESAQKVAVDARTRAEVALIHVKEERARADTEKKRAEDQAVIAGQQKQEADAQKLIAVNQSAIAQQKTAIAESESQRAEAERLNAVAKAKEASEQKANAEVAKGQADKEKTRAVASETEARRLSHLAFARALALKIASDRRQDANTDQVHDLLALEVDRLNRENGGRPQDPDVFSAMRTALSRVEAPPVLKGSRDAIRALSVPRDGHTVLTGGDDGSILSFDLNGHGEPTNLGNVESPVRSLAVSARGELLAVGTAAGKIMLQDLRNSAAPHRMIDAGSGSVSALAFQPGGHLLAAGTLDGLVGLWNLDDPAAAPTTLLHNSGGVSSVAFSADGKMLAAGLMTSKGAIVWDLVHPDAQARHACGGDTMARGGAKQDIRSIAFRPDGKVLACGIRSGKIIQDPLGTDITLPTPLTGHASSVNSLTYNPSGDFLASASSDGTVRIWDAKTSGVQAIILPGHESWVWAVAFTPDGKRLISAGQDRMLRIWPARTEVLAADLCRKVFDPAWYHIQSLNPYVWRDSMPADVPQRELPCPGKK